MSRKYISQVNNQNFVFPNNEVSEYDVEIIHDVNDNCVSGSVINFSATTISEEAKNARICLIKYCSSLESLFQSSKSFCNSISCECHIAASCCL